MLRLMGVGRTGVLLADIGSAGSERNSEPVGRRFR